MGSYPKKSIALMVAAFCLIVMNAIVVIILNYYIEIGNILYYLSVWVNHIIYYSVYMTVTGVFFFLADFGFEARSNQVRPTLR